ncbi:MAG: fructosamine kinase family protein [Gammaproteobacteria bacterium]|nr:fructosamine kinase family protein [Gammaproteobacteria bacterium]
MDWASLAAKLAAQLRIPSLEARATPLSGGNISRACRLEFGTARFFVKLNRAEWLSMFVAEAAGLDAIRHSQTIRVPEVYLTSREGNHALIIMEYIDLTGAVDRDLLARQLAAMHGCYHDRFGFDCDNTIGSTPQINEFCDDWIEFWRLHRLGFQLTLARKNGCDSRLIDSGNRLAENLAPFFDSYRPRPSLLHGDLWSGNQGADEAGNPVIFDPACYYGDHQADLAMMELFGHPGERFFAIYREHFALDDGYPLRRDLYNLYHLLNHANLFGGSYPAQSQRVIDHLLSQLH